PVPDPAGRLDPPGADDGFRRRAAGVALSPRQDGRAHHRQPARHRRLAWRRLLEGLAVQAAVPRPVGDQEPGLMVAITFSSIAMSVGRRLISTVVRAGRLSAKYSA